MLEALKERHRLLAQSCDQLAANLNATVGAKQEIERLIAQLEQEASAQRSAEVDVPAKRRGPKPGFRRVAAAEPGEPLPPGFAEQFINTEFANDVVRDAE